MADNVTLPGAGVVVGSDEVTIGAVLQQVQRVKLVDGADGGTSLIGGDATNGLDVDVTRLPALVAGTANIGDIDVLTVPAPLSTTGNGTAATALRVSIASDTTGVLAVTDNAGSLTTDTTGTVAHDGVGTSTNPLAVGGYASAAAPSDVSLDGDVVRAWHLRNGAAASVITAAGALVGGDAANGLDVDVTRLPALVAGTANIGDVDVLTVPAPLSVVGNGTAATAMRVTVASDSAAQFAEDVGHTTGDVGIFSLAVREDTPTSTAGTTGDYTAITADQKGRTWVNNSTTVLANGQVAPNGTAATLVAARATRNRLILLNTGDREVFIGIATVTTANGFRLDPGASITLNTSALVQAITTSGTGAVSYIEEYD